MEVHWRGLSVSIGGKRILAPTSGHVGQGRMVAIMGPSGCGKTTFLSTLNQEIPYEGHVRLNGATWAPELRHLIGFCEQDDIVIPQLSVRQSLHFYATLRSGAGGKGDPSARVEEVLGKMKLQKVGDTRVGDDAQRGISGGERKRLCIARELLGGPRLLLLDEPTSGLDSSLASSVVTSMRNLCDKKEVTIMASIHQPSTTIFETFDDLLLLREGEVLYFGPVQEVDAHFARHGLTRPLSQGVAEHVMDLMVFEDRLPISARTALIKDVNDEMSKLKPLGQALKPKEVLDAVDAAVCSGRSSGRYIAPFTVQVTMLSHRCWILLRSELFTKVSTVQNVLLMLVPSLLWWRLDDTEMDIFPRTACILWILGTWMFFPIFGSVAVFPSVKRILRKELSIGCYSLSAFYIASTLAVLPLHLAWPMAWTTGVYWMTNLNPSFLVFLQVLMVTLTTFVFMQGIGLAVSAGVKPSNAGTVCVVLITFFFAYAGLFMEVDRLPELVKWCVECNFFLYAYQLMLHIVLSDFDFRCSGDPQLASKATILCSSDADVITGEEAKALHGVDKDPGVCLVVVLIGLAFFRVLTFVLLRHDLRTTIKGAKGGTGVDAVAASGETDRPSLPHLDKAARAAAETLPESTHDKDTTEATAGCLVAV